MRKWLRAEAANVKELILLLQEEIIPKMKKGLTSGEDWAVEEVK